MNHEKTSKEMEAVEQMKFLGKRYQEAMAKYDELSKQLKDIKDSSQNLLSKHELVVGSHQGLRNEIAEFAKEVAKTNSNLRKELNSFSVILNQFSLVEEERKKEVGGLKNECGSLLANLLKVHDRVQKIEQSDVIVNLKKEIADVKNQMGLNYVSHRDDAARAKNSHEELKQVVNNLSAEISQSKKALESHRVASDSLYNEFKSLKLTSTTAFHDMKGIIMKYVDDKISAIPQPVIPSLDDVKKQMQSQLEPVSFDAKNSHLRSTNNESKITILEKKVEQLQLLVNKLQLKE